MAAALPARRPPARSPLPAAATTLAGLAEKIAAIEAAARPAREGCVSTGSAALDRLLPERGLPRGTLVEWLAMGPASGGEKMGLAPSTRHALPGGAGNREVPVPIFLQPSGAASLALLAAAEAARTSGAVVVVDRPGAFYPPAAAALGLELDRLILVRPTTARDEAWAVDQALRSRGVAAVWCPLETIAERTLRRWQLAAAGSGALGLLVRPAAARDAPSWAELRWAVQPLPGGGDGRRRLRVELLRPRTAIDCPVTEFTFNAVKSSSHETHPVHLAAALARRAPRRRRA